jgi:hypothetical protein
MRVETGDLIRFTESDIEDLDVELKVGILATVNEEGLPHVTMLSSLRPYAETGLVFGQFTEGLSKQFVRSNPMVGFLILSLDRQVWRGKADFSHTAKTGLEFENYNNLPMFRYNAYFGIHTVYYLNLISNSGRQSLPMGKVVFAAITTIIARTLGSRPVEEKVLNTWVRRLFNKVDNLKFISYIGKDGYPVILPVIQTQVMNGQWLAFSSGYLGVELREIPAGIPMAVLCMSFDMEDVLVRGEYQGIHRVGGIPCGLVKTDWVYNSMPPKPQQVYPPVQVKPVTDF